MKVLVIGSGGREHAICWKLAQSQRVKQLFCAPGNPGTAEVAENVPISAGDVEALAGWAEREQVDLTVVGPELPLSIGLVDLLKARRLTVFGPTRAAAQLESSKRFAKEVMEAARVPTAYYRCFTDSPAALDFLQRQPPPFVLKADGLAAGKGVFVCPRLADAEAALVEIFGSLGSTLVVVEEFLPGTEASLIVATDGERVCCLPPAHDYKRVGDGDQGPNTGGMGTVCPTGRLSPSQTEWAVEHVIRPVLSEMARRGTPFCGFLYAGLMISPRGELRVLEFNARLGDPETQVILPLLKTDLFEVLLGLAAGTGRSETLELRPGNAVCVVLASAGYPASASKGDVIEGAAASDDVLVFHAGTALGTDGKLVTAGGRVLNVVGLGSDLSKAREKAYAGCRRIAFPGMQFRRDIGLS